MATSTTRRKRPVVVANAVGPPPETVSVAIAPPFAVYFDGQQRTGIVRGVPFATAVYWMRQRWAHCAWCPAPDHES